MQYLIIQKFQWMITLSMPLLYVAYVANFLTHWYTMLENCLHGYKRKISYRNQLLLLILLQNFCIANKAFNQLMVGIVKKTINFKKCSHFQFFICFHEHVFIKHCDLDFSSNFCKLIKHFLRMVVLCSSHFGVQYRISIM